MRYFSYNEYDENNVDGGCIYTVIEEVFGEFRPMIIEMRSALYDDDKTRIRGLLAEL
jgi:hypothetical protein